ncbi:MAG: 2-hydroxyacid dehydrogenase [Alphaproteobacteria bacterium]
MSGNQVEVVALIDFPEVTDKRLRENFVVHNLYEADDQAAMLKELAPRVRGVATMGQIGCTAEIMAALPNLEIISCYAVGVDAVDMPAAREHDVIVTNTPDVLNDCVADLAVGLTISLLRDIPNADHFVRNEPWYTPTDYPLTRALGGKTLGVVGLGRIGMGAAKRAQAFGMNIAYHNRSKRDDVDFAYYASPAELAANCDVMVLLCPGGPATQHLIDKDVLDALGPDGFLVSISRGTVVDEAALVDALVNNRIAGAAMDVFEHEPQVPDALKQARNVILTPHMGSGTRETRAAMGNLMIDNLIAHFSGKPVLTRVE